jgi:hypothetical protein
MGDFKLDTSGRVPVAVSGGHTLAEWPDLSPFVQGYVEALLKGLYRQEQDAAAAKLGRAPMPAFARYCFRHLAPETLAPIIEDCERADHLRPGASTAGDTASGEQLWTLRQAGKLDRFPPQTLYLCDDGKVRFK